MKFTRQEEIAILVVSVLGNHIGETVPVSDIAKDHGVSVLFLKKILRELRQAGIVQSKEGIGGGYTLVKQPKDISVLDVFTAVDGTKDASFITSETHRYNTLCPLQPDCLPQQIRQLISTAFLTYLSHITIDAFITKERNL